MLSKFSQSKSAFGSSYTKATFTADMSSHKYGTRLPKCPANVCHSVKMIYDCEPEIFAYSRDDLVSTLVDSEVPDLEYFADSEGESVEAEVPEDVQPVTPVEDVPISEEERAAIFEGYAADGVAEVVSEVVSEPVEMLPDVPVEVAPDVPVIPRLTRANSIWSVLKAAQRNALRDKVLQSAATV